MLDKLFKTLRKKMSKGWHRGGYRDVPVHIGFGRNWASEEIERANPEYMNFGNGIWADTAVSASSTGGTSTKQIRPEKKEVKPKDVMNELNEEKPNLDLNNLDAKIKAMKKRRDFMKEDIGTIANEEENAISWLEARKKAVKKKIINKFDWPVTTPEKIAALLSKYKLRKASFAQYSLAVPEEAIDEMEKYSLLCEEVTDDKPEFILIIPDTKEFEEKKRDPIVVATSPFGRFLHVIGAWDKEVAIMHELYFEKK